MNIIVIGGGASGLMVAGMCAKNGHNVVLLEKNEKLGKKLYITGKGRCNVTNLCDNTTFLSNVVNNSKFLYGALYGFSPYDTMDFIESNNCKLKVERGNRVFPESDKSSDIIKVFSNFCLNNGVQIKLNEEVKECYKNGEIFITKTNNDTYKSDVVVVCTGGVSYTATGCDGFGYKLAKRFGHTIVEPRPGLCPIKLKDSLIKDIQGISLKNITLKSYENDKLIRSEFGEMLFTNDGISGPIALTTSSYINRCSNVKLFIDFKPALSEEKLENRLLRDFEENKNAQLSSIVRGLLPKNLVPVFISKTGISPTKQVNSITTQERKELVNKLKNFELHFDRIYDINYAIITSGGVNIKEINPKTMESKLVSGLYFSGEVLDVDALTGGFNIQIALSTAVAVSKGV